MFDGNARRQADQISRIADGRRSGNITNTESSELLRDQVTIADARGDADSPAEFNALNNKLNAADKDINYHSKAGTQFHWKPLPWPQPIPLPAPLPLPQPIPMPAPQPLPFPGPISTLPSKPEVQPLQFRGVING
jgi:hypothetical protein